MLKIQLGLILIILNLAFQVQSKEINEERLLKHIQYITEVSTLKYNGEPLPKVKFIKPALLQIFYHGELKVAQSERTGEGLPVVTGLYDPQRKTLYVSEQFEENGQSDDPTLVHELVHYLQDINGITESYGDKTQCLEGLAYDIQATWQYEHKVMLDQVPDYNTILLAFMKCEQQFKN